ncbi:MAG: hypothetical protein ACLT98_07120 [Eggerthellaceae bacterium]
MAMGPDTAPQVSGRPCRRPVPRQRGNSLVGADQRASVQATAWAQLLHAVQLQRGDRALRGRRALRAGVIGGHESFLSFGRSYDSASRALRRAVPFGYPETVAEGRRRKGRGCGRAHHSRRRGRRDINALLAKIAAREGSGCVQAYSGTEALLQMERAVRSGSARHDAAGHGWADVDGVHARRAGPRVPVIVVSAKAARRQGGYARGQRGRLRDEALRPRRGGRAFMRCCAARERARLRARAASADDEALVHRDLRLTSRRRVTLEDAEVALTAHEFDILHVLMGSPDKVFSRELLYELGGKTAITGAERRQRACQQHPQEAGGGRRGGRLHQNRVHRLQAMMRALRFP